MSVTSPRVIARQAQRGAATLVVVMVMFLILALMSAYASRNLVFEQRIASNYVRSSLATELADAGIEWTLAQLNGRNIDASCSANDSAGSSFRSRYLNQDPNTRAVVPFSFTNSKMAASCVRSSASSWSCQCPEPDRWADSPPSSQPSFGVQFQALTRPGVFRLVSTGCTASSVTACTSFTPVGDPLIGGTTVRAEVALLSALKTPPSAPLVLAGTLSANDLGLHNSDPRSGGTLMNSGGDAPSFAEDRLDSLPGTPPQLALLDKDPVLKASTAPSATPDALFRLFFGMPRDKYRNQPAMLRLQCNGDCSSQLAGAYTKGARMVWISGPLILANPGVLGSAASPLLIVADGPVSLSGQMALTGLLYANDDVSWANASGSINGTLISAGSVSITGHVDLWYQGAVMDALSNATGSFVRVPDSWTDG